jgi:hypothetical protein
MSQIVETNDTLLHIVNEIFVQYLYQNVVNCNNLKQKADFNIFWENDYTLYK